MQTDTVQAAQLDALIGRIDTLINRLDKLYARAGVIDLKLDRVAEAVERADQSG